MKYNKSKEKDMKLKLIGLYIVIITFVPVSTIIADETADFAPIKYERENMTEEMRISRGGQLYDNWWKTSPNTDKPTEDQPLWKTQNVNKRSGYSTYRCKECHGWDYRGKDGTYSKGSHFTGFQGVYDASKKMSLDELKGVLRGETNKDHNFTQILNDDDIADLALFQKHGTIDLMKLVNTDASLVGGNITEGSGFFSKNCMTECHGPTGTSINFGTEEKPEFIATVAKKNPWEFIHKVRAGQPGTRMSSGIINNWRDEDILNLLAYSQTLPAAAPEEGWFDRILSAIGLGEKEHTEYVHEEHRGFGPKFEQ
jgi:thiosulfate dehydrogenase